MKVHSKPRSLLMVTKERFRFIIIILSRLIKLLFLDGDVGIKFLYLVEEVKTLFFVFV